MKETKIKVLKVEPKKLPEVCELENELEALQKAVSIGADYQGLIEILYVNEGICILCNEEGKLIGLEPNRRIRNDILCGVFYVTGQDREGNLTSLTDDEIETFKSIFGVIEDISQDEVEPTMRIYFE